MNEFWQQYGVVGGVAGWALLSMVLNTLLKLHSADQWVQRIKTNRYGVTAVTFLETVGIDPVSFIRHLQEDVNKKADG